MLDQITAGKIEPENIPHCIYPSSDRTKWQASKIKLHRNAFKWPTLMFNGSEAEMQILQAQIAKENKRLFTIWETTRGGPYSCYYCDWGGGIETKVIAKFAETIATELDWMQSLNIGYIEFCDSNFGILKERDVNIITQLVDRSHVAVFKDSVSL